MFALNALLYYEKTMSEFVHFLSTDSSGKHSMQFKGRLSEVSTW